MNADSGNSRNIRPAKYKRFTVYKSSQSQPWSHRLRANVHSKKNWSAQLGNLLVYSELTSLVHYVLLCTRLCLAWTLQVLGHLQEVHKFVCLTCKLLEVVHLLCTQVSKDLKCPSGAQPCTQKSISK